MGRTSMDFEIRNYADVHDYEAGRLPFDRIRRTTISGIVDTGAARLVLPSSAVAILGLPVVGQSSVRYADHRRSNRDVVRDAQVLLLGRSGVFQAIVEPSRTDALIGAIVLEDLDLLVDCVRQRLIPRDPNTIITEIE